MRRERAVENLAVVGSDYCADIVFRDKPRYASDRPGIGLLGVSGLGVPHHEVTALVSQLPPRSPYSVLVIGSGSRDWQQLVPYQSWPVMIDESRSAIESYKQ